MFISREFIHNCIHVQNVLYALIDWQHNFPFQSCSKFSQILQKSSLKLNTFFNWNLPVLRKFSPRLNVHLTYLPDCWTNNFQISRRKCWQSLHSHSTFMTLLEILQRNLMGQLIIKTNHWSVFPLGGPKLSFVRKPLSTMGFNPHQNLHHFFRTPRPWNVV